MKNDIVVVRRMYARGDVLLATTLLPILERKYKIIYFQTDPRCFDILQGNPYIDQVVSSNHLISDVIDLDLSYESNPKMHIVEAYAKRARFNQLEIEELNKLRPYILRKNIPIDSGCVVIHPANSWKSRTMPLKFWQDLINKINKKIYIIGQPNDSFGLKIPNNVIDLRGKLSVNECAYLISISAVLIGSDSLMLHVGATTNTKIIGIYTSAESKYRYPWRKKYEYPWKPEEFISIEAKVDCYGCLHREPPPVTTLNCPKNINYACVESISIDMVMDVL